MSSVQRGVGGAEGAGPGGPGPGGGGRGNRAGWAGGEGAQQACFTKGLWAHQTLATNLPAGPGGDVAKPGRLLHGIAAEWFLEMELVLAPPEPSLRNTIYQLALRTPECQVPLCGVAD